MSVVVAGRGTEWRTAKALAPLLNAYERPALLIATAIIALRKNVCVFMSVCMSELHNCAEVKS